MSVNMKDKMLDILVAGYGAFHYSMTLFWTYVIIVWTTIFTWAILRVLVK